MARKIFVSYKYADSDVEAIVGTTGTTVRDYVDILEETISEDHIFKGEHDGEDLSDRSEDYIEESLRERMFDSSITVILLSPNMIDDGKPEKQQWIPREVSYSLRKKSRGDDSSIENGMIAVVLPDKEGSYSYAVAKEPCVTVWRTDTYFDILDRHMFNLKDKVKQQCSTCGGSHHNGHNHSYIHPQRWEDFLSDLEENLERAIERRDNIEEYEIKKNLE